MAPVGTAPRLRRQAELGPRVSLLALDSRWRRFTDESWACPCCGQAFNGVFDIGFDHPDCWPHGSLRDSGQETLQVGEDKLSSDLCRWEEHRFLRAILPLPIRGSDEVFNFGCWVSVAPDNFYLYIEDAVGEAPGFEGCFAWLMNALPLFDGDTPVAGDVVPGPAEQRPVFKAHDGALATAQAEGITFDQLLDIYAATGSDIRPHLVG